MGWCPVRQKGINGRLQARSPPTTGADTPRDFLVVAVSFPARPSMPCTGVFRRGVCPWKVMFALGKPAGATNARVTNESKLSSP